MNLTLAVDCGTSNLKAGLVNSEGKLVAHTSRPIELQHPEPDAAEHSPQDIYDAFRSAVREVSSGRRDGIVMMGLSGYQFGFMPMDSDYRPLTGMITLLDGRSRREVTRMTDLLPQEELYRISGLPPMFTSLLTKILWMKREKQELFGKTAFFADIKSFLLHRLTGRFVTEPSIAATTQMLDLSTMDWAPRLVEAAGITTDQLPEVVSGDETAGTLSSAAAEELNLPLDLPVLPGLYDGGAMMVGMGGL
ncbi:MAG: FGGY family carbohydrate kinase, partial [Planctomycetota bacterium]